MPRKGLAIQEALALFEELPLDIDSEISDYISDEDENIISWANEDILSSHDEELTPAPDESAIPGPSRIYDVNWRKKENLNKTFPEFMEPSGPTEEITSMETITPLNVFLSIFTVDFMEKIAFVTNLYATQQGKKFSPIDVNDIIVFLGINLLMGIKKLPSVRDFWSSNELLNDSFISKQMPVKRFTWILGNLHLNDNSIMPNRGDPNFDKLYKVRPLLDHLSAKFSSLYKPGKYQSVDESMIRFKGRSSLKQYMPKKPIKRGYKVWMRCDGSGYACKFEIYSGKMQEVERNLGESVVKLMCEPLFGKNHWVYIWIIFLQLMNFFGFLKQKTFFAVEL